MMNTLDQEQSDMIASSRFPLIILVVFIHAGPVAFFPYSTLYQNVDVFLITYRGIAQVLSAIAVPCFFLISGFLFFIRISKFNSREYFLQLYKRIFTLLVPYVLWNLLFIVIILVKNYIFEVNGLSVDDLYRELTSDAWVQILWANELPVNYPLWFLRDLICMVLLSPLFYLYFNYFKFIGVLILITINLIGIDLGVPGLSMTGLTFFGIGSYLAMNKKNIKLEFYALRYYCFAGAVLCGFLSFFYIETEYFKFVNRLYVFFGLVTFFNGISFVIKNDLIRDQLKRLNAAVFFIYCAHAIYFIEFVRGFFARTFLAHSDWGLSITYFLITLFVVVICTILYFILVKILPTVMRVLLGSRISIPKPEAKKS